MIKPVVPVNEKERQQALDSYDVLDTLPEKEYQDLIQIAAQICQTPISLVSLIDTNRQWFKARIGLAAQETPREIAFCAHAIHGNTPFVVEDASKDERFHDNPLVTGELGIRFYAGTPLINGEGQCLGTVCVIDQVPRKLNPEQLNALQSLGRQVVHLLELRKAYRKQKEQTDLLIAQEKKYELLVNSLHEAIFQCDREGKFLFLNPAWEEMTGFSVSESLQRKFFEHVHPENQLRLQKSFETLVNEKATDFRLQYRALKKDGSIAWFEIFARLKLNSNAENPIFTGTLTDITVQKELEESRIKMTNSARLSSLGEMAAGMAHEINNPLAVIKAKVQILIKKIEASDLSPENLIQTLKQVDKTVSRISRIIGSLRNFARESSDDPMEPKSMAGIIDDTLELCQARFQNNGILFEISKPPQDCTLNCRPIQISQILLNLLNNAFDAVQDAPVKKVRLVVECKKEEIEISISDSGPGIPPEIREKIMQPFFTTKEVGHGTGLGLSLSKGIAESHHGQLFLDSESTETRFILKLPKVRQPQVA